MGKQKKGNEVVIQEHDIPFINPNNMDYIKVLKVNYQVSDGTEQVFYTTQIDCARLVEHIVSNDPLDYHINFRFVKDSLIGSVFIYVYEDGYYKLVNDDEFKGFLKEYIPSRIRKVKDIDEVFKLLLMENQFYIDNNDLNREYDYINFKNGLLNLNTMTLEEHTPDKFFTVQIPVCYKPLDECTRGNVFENYMNFLTDNDEVVKNVLLESMGLVLSNIPGYLTKKCILMIGAKDCGKTQIKKLLTELIGIRNTSSMDLDKMNDSRFGTSELYNKRLAGSNDMRYTTINDMGIFKQLTGGDPISLEFKGKGAFSYIYNGFIWFLANDFPMFSGKKGKEIYDRFLVVPCRNIVEKDRQDPLIVQKMLKEKEYIVALCVQHLLDLRARKFKFIESESMKMENTRYQLANNSLLQFVDEYCVVDDDLMSQERLNFSVFKRNYQRWCRDLGINPMKIGKEEVEYYLGDKYGTKVVKSSTYFISNIKMSDNFEKDYGFGG